MMGVANDVSQFCIGQGFDCCSVQKYFLSMGCIMQFSMVISLKTVLSRKLFILFYNNKFPALISLDSLLHLLPTNYLGSMDT
jgi:hypothetical protein